MEIIAILPHIGCNVSGSFRQERFLYEFINNGNAVDLLIPYGISKGSYKIRNLDDCNLLIQNISEKSLPTVSISGSYLSRKLRWIKMFLPFDLFGYGFIYSLYKLQALIKNKRKVVFVSSPPISSAFAVYLCSKFGNIRYIVDMRDAWANHPAKKVKNLFYKHIERAILKNAFTVSTVSNYLANEFKSAANIQAVEVLYNVATQVSKIQPIERNDNMFRIAYIGTCPDNFYNIDEVLNGFEMLANDSENSIVSDFHLSFYGENYNVADRIVRYKKLLPKTDFHPPVTHQRAIDVMVNSDAVLFLGYNGLKNCGVVGTKIFEYIELNLNIIPFDIKKNSDLEALFIKTYGSCPIISNANQFYDYITDVIDKKVYTERKSDYYLSDKYIKNYRAYINRVVS